MHYLVTMTDRTIDIAALRNRLGVSRKELAELVGVKATSTVCRWENGTKEPSGAALTLLKQLDLQSKGKGATSARILPTSRKHSKHAAE